MVLKFNIFCVLYNGVMGLMELMLYFSIIDYVVISGCKLMLENVDSYCENFCYFLVIKNVYYVIFLFFGYLIGYIEEVLEKYIYFNGSFWLGDIGFKIMV